MVDLMVIRSISLGVMLVAATALIAGVTLLPAVLGLLSFKLERLRVIPKGKPKPESEGFWYRFSHAVMRRPWAWLSVSLAIILVLAWPAREMKLLGATPKLLPGAAESVKGVDILNEEFGENLLSPIQIVVTTPDEGVFTPKFLVALDRLTNSLEADPRAASVTSLATYMVAEPRDGRWSRITAKHDFAPAPDIANLEEDEVTPGVFLDEHDRRLGRRGPAQPGLLRLRTVQLPERRRPPAQGHADVPGLPRQHRQPEGPGERPGQALAQRRLRRARQGPGRSPPARKSRSHRAISWPSRRRRASGCGPTRRPR